MIYAIIILFILVLALFIKVGNKPTLKQLRNLDITLSGRIQTLGKNMEERTNRKVAETAKHMHAHFDSVKKLAKNTHDESVDRDLDLHKVLNEFLKPHGFEIALVEVPLTDTEEGKEIMKSFKGSLPSFLQEMAEHMDTSLLSGITEQKLVLRKVAKAKKPRRR